MRTDYLDPAEMQHVLAALTPPNRLAVEVSMATGLRIGDVLQLRTEQIEISSDGRLTVREQKTGKTRRVRIPVELHQRALRMAGRRWVFEGRLDERRHRTRQAVHKDLVRAAKLFRAHGVIAPHSARKIWAVGQLRRTGSIAKVQELLQHSSEAVTMVYALADELTRRKHAGK